MKDVLASLSLVVAILTVYAGLALVYWGETLPLECRRFTGTAPPEPTLTVTHSGRNWTVELAERWGERFPKSQMFLRMRDPYGVDRFGMMRFTDLTMANWATFHVVFQDIHPGIPGTCDGDRLLIDRTSYGLGSAFAVSFGNVLIATGFLH